MLTLIAVFGLLAGVVLPASVLGVEGSQFQAAASSDLGAVASISVLASHAGVRVLHDGGNAIDAAVATVFAVGVTRPDMCGIGGGGFLVYRGADGTTAALDFRERAPASATPETFLYRLRNDGTMALQREGHWTVLVPGTVAGMAAALERYGTFSLREAIEPARMLAADGFPVSTEYSVINALIAPFIRQYQESARVYLVGGVAPYPPGATLRLEDYARSLDQIAAGGPSEFYTGHTASLIIEEMARAGTDPTDGPPVGNHALMTAADLASYTAVWREPIHAAYRGYEVIGMPPPTSGGVALAEMLNILEGFDLRAAGQSSADHLHYLAEAEKIAFADRAAYLGDPDYRDIPVAMLTSKDYAADRRSEISRELAGSYEAGNREDGTSAPPSSDTEETGDTTHVSVVDRWGNAVAVTCSVGGSFGSAIVARGTGFFLNNHLWDFSDPGTANQADGGKRPRSSQSPTILVREGKPVLAVGGGGAQYIIMGALQAVVNTVDFDLDVTHAIDAERLEARPAECADEVMIEDVRLPPGVVEELERRGHPVHRQGEYAGGIVEVSMDSCQFTTFVQAAGWNRTSGATEAASDPRWEGGPWAVNEPPRADGTADRTEVNRLRPVHFTDLSTDGDGRIVRWLWDFGDGKYSTDQNPSHLYKQLGNFGVSLTVWDDCPVWQCGDLGDADTAHVATITVKNIPPTGITQGPNGNGAGSLDQDLEGNRVEPAQFDDASTDPDGSVVAWAWNFGDGGASTERDPSHQYAELGTFIARVTPTDNDDDAGSEGTRTVRVVNLLPSPDFTHRRAYPNVLEPVEFLDASSDRDGDVVAWAWDFGDGHTSDEARPWHVFLRGGWHTVALSVEDNDGGAANLARSLYVCNPTGEYDALADPQHVHVEFQACLRLDGGDLPLLPMGAGFAGGLPGAAWLLTVLGTLVARRVRR